MYLVAFIQAIHLYFYSRKCVAHIHVRNSFSIRVLADSVECLWLVYMNVFLIRGIRNVS